MKLTILIPLMLFSSFWMRDCIQVEPIVGSDDVQVINDVEFEVTAKELNYYSLKVRGTIKNNSTKKISPPWHIEADFYSDNLYSFKLGGASDQINYALYTGETTAWELTFSSNSIDEGKYPNFAVKNFRAFYK